MRRLTTFALAVGLALPACNATPEEQAQALCTVVCRCMGPGLPGLQAECVNECVEDLPPITIPEACVACISGHANSCATLERDCEPVCDVSEPPEPIDD